MKTHIHVLTKNLREIICKLRKSKFNDSKYNKAINICWININTLNVTKSKNDNSILPTLIVSVSFNKVIKINVSF